MFDVRGQALGPGKRTFMHQGKYYKCRHFSLCNQGTPGQRGSIILDTGIAEPSLVRNGRRVSKIFILGGQTVRARYMDQLLHAWSCRAVPATILNSKALSEYIQLLLFLWLIWVSTKTSPLTSCVTFSK